MIELREERGKRKMLNKEERGKRGNGGRKKRGDIEKREEGK